ncbi:MAG: TonB-dependent receptor [Rhodomicrobium sp.]|nr:TonB-dependent receptor [Rhodomicrobium sp.]
MTASRAERIVVANSENVFDTRAGLNTPEQSIVAKGITGVAEWRASENITLKNILSYREDRSEGPIDFDSLPVVDVDVPGIYDNSQFSEEFQILYEGDRLNGILGFYYLDASGLTQFDVALDLTAALLMFPGVTAFTSTDVDTSTWSVFGDFTFDLTDEISVSVGGRYTSDERSISLQRFRYFTAGSSPFFGGPDRPPSLVDASLDAEERYSDFSPRPASPGSRRRSIRSMRPTRRASKAAASIRAAARTPRPISTATAWPVRRMSTTRLSFADSIQKRSTPTSSAGRTIFSAADSDRASRSSTATIRTCRCRARSASTPTWTESPRRSRA